MLGAAARVICSSLQISDLTSYQVVCSLLLFSMIRDKHSRTASAKLTISLSTAECYISTVYSLIPMSSFNLEIVSVRKSVAGWETVCSQLCLHNAARWGSIMQPLLRSRHTCHACISSYCKPDSIKPNQPSCDLLHATWCQSPLVQDVRVQPRTAISVPSSLKTNSHHRLSSSGLYLGYFVHHGGSRN